MITNTLEDYLALPYTIEIIPDDGGWVISIKELPGCMTQSDDWNQLLPLIQDAQRLWIESSLAHGDSIPLPQRTV